MMEETIAADFDWMKNKHPRQVEHKVVRERSDVLINFSCVIIHLTNSIFNTLYLNRLIAISLYIYIFIYI